MYVAASMYMLRKKFGAAAAAAAVNSSSSSSISVSMEQLAPDRDMCATMCVGWFAAKLDRERERERAKEQAL